MATWHQLKAGVSAAYAPHPTQFKLLENPPGELLTIGLHYSKADAEAYIDRRVNVYKNGRREDFSIIAPKGK